MKGVFSHNETTDNKRFVRAKLWSRAAELLKGVKNPWLATLAGMNPDEEFRLMRKLIPGCQILAVDKKPAAARAAREAGADDVMCGEIFKWTEMSFMKRCSVINLDMCGPLNQQVIDGTAAYVKNVSVLMLTFTYCRQEDRKYIHKSYKGSKPEVGARVERIDRQVGRTLELIEPYKGNGMAMCSLLWS